MTADQIKATLGKVTVELPDGYGTVALPGHIFKSGSYGYYGAGKIDTNAGRYQVSVNVTLIGSKGTFSFDADGNVIS